MITIKMKRALSGIKIWHILILIFLLSFIAVAPPLAQAAVPRYINYQGKLTDANDDPVTGDVSITIRIYDVDSGGTALWTETQTTTVTRGIFSILLGNSTVLDSLDFNSPYWYSVEVESDGEMTPRQRLTSVGYAINADKLDGYDASQFLRADADTSLTGALTVSGNITGSANGDITLDPTGTGNIIMKIDSTSGDFKITDGTTNWVKVSNAGAVTIAKDLTVSGTIYGNLASTGGDSTFSSIVVTGTSDLRGNISNSSGAVTVADALTQTGATNQVTFAGNVDANNGLDVTGALTASGQTTLSSTLNANSNVAVSYSGSSAALDVTQSSTGPAAQFAGQRVIVGANELTNTNALSTGELYVLGDLEVDGTIYGNVSSSGTTALGDTALASLTVTGTSDLKGNISNSTGALTVADNFSVAKTDSSTSGTVTLASIQPTFQDSGTNSTTTAIGLNVAPTINYTGATKSGSYTALKIAATETSLPTGTSYLIDAYAGADAATQKFYVDNSGNAKIFGTLNMNSQKITNLGTPTAGTDAVTKTYADAITPASAGGWTDAGTGVYLLTAADNVGIGTASTGTYKLNVSGSTNTTSLYIGGTQVNATAANLNELVGGSSTTLHTHAASGISGTAIVASPSTAQTIQPTADVVPLTIKGKASAASNVMSIYDAAAVPSEKIYVDSAGHMYVAETTTGAAQASTATLYFGRNATDNWEAMGYDPTLGTKGMFTFSAPLQVEASSPTGITFVEKNAQGAITKSQGFMYNPTTDEFSFTGGTLKQTFQNLVRNGSFESYRPSGWENVNTTYGTDMDMVADALVAKFGSKYLRVLDNDTTLAKGVKFRVPTPDRFFGNNLTLSVWARAASGTATASIGYSYSTANTNASTAKNISLTATWQNFRWTLPDTVPTTTTTVVDIYLYGAGVSNPNSATGVGTITGAATNSDYVYFDGITLAQGNLALDYGPTPILDTGNQVMYGNLAIGANSDPKGGGQPTLVFGEPDSSFYHSGYTGWSMESGQIKYELMSGDVGRFMFNKPIKIFPGYTTNLGAGFYLGDSGTVNYAIDRTDAYIQGNLEVDGTIYGNMTSKGNLNTALTGTLAVTNLSIAVTGTTTAFTTELAVGDSIKIETEIFTVSAITSATSLTLDTAYQGATTSGLTAYRDSNLFLVQNGDAVSKLTLDKSGNLTVSGTITQGGTGVIDGSGTANYISKFSNENTLANSVIYESTGLVGIGTTIPAQKLDVAGNIAVSGTVDGYDISLSGPNWDTAYTDRLKWDGGAVGLNAATGRTSLGLGSLATLSAVSGGIAGTITDATVTNDDISATAGIVDTKLATISTADKVSDSALSATVTKLGQTIESAEITDLTIANADISATAGIVTTKLADSTALSDAMTKRHTQGTDTTLGTMTANIAMGSYKITGLGEPASDQDATTKYYVDNAIAGLSWKEAVIDKDLATPPVSPAENNRYLIASTGATGAWLTKENNYARYHNNAWVFEAPEPGDAVFTEDEKVAYTYNGTSWVAFTGASAYIWGYGLTNTGTTISIDTTEAVDLSTAQTLTNKTLSTGTVLPTDYYASTYVNEGQASSVTSAMITDGEIANSDISASASIATSKLSGAVTSIASHGLGTLATLSAVGSAEITDGAITTSDISATAGILDSQLATSPATRFYENFAEYIETGLQPATSANLTSDISLGTAYVRGARVNKASATSKTYTLNKDTYVDIDNLGAFTYTEVLNAAAAPSVAANSIRLAKVVTGASAITSVTDLRNLYPVTANEIAPGAVTSTGIADGSIGTAKLADSAVTSIKIADGTIMNVDINDNAAIAGTKISASFGSQNITTAGNIITTGTGVMTSAGLITAGAGINVSGGNIAITDASNIVLNTDKITLYGATGNATLTGALTQLRSIGLTPDYDNATLNPDGSNNFGTMILKYDSSHNYYEWTTSEPTTQDYDIVIRYRLPDGFSSFDAAAPIKLWNKVSATPGATKVDVTMLDTAGSAVTLTDGATLKNTAWTESTITIGGSPEFTAGGYITITIKMSADQVKVADVGELTLKGNW